MEQSGLEITNGKSKIKMPASTLCFSFLFFVYSKGPHADPRTTLFRDWKWQINIYRKPKLEQLPKGGLKLKAILTNGISIE